MESAQARSKAALEASAIPQVPRVSHVEEQYPAMVRNGRLRASDLRALRREALALGERPTMTLLLPIQGNVSPGTLRRTLDSMMAQVYPAWELRPLCRDEGDVGEGAWNLLGAYARLDERMLAPIRRSDEEEALNAGLERASGEFVGVVDAGDELAPDALFRVARLLGEHPDADLLYADEDRIDERGERVRPRFKPGWSPHLLLSMDYIGRPALYRKSRLTETGGFRSGLGGARDYDVALRVTERTPRVHHVPGVLYHRATERPVTSAEGHRVLAWAMQRREMEGAVEDGLAPGTFRVRQPVRGEPRVTIVLPTGGKVPLLSRCIESIESRTSYTNYEIVIVDNSGGKAREYLSRTPHRVVVFEGDFDYSSINNLGVRESTGEYVLLLNDDTEITSPDWMEEMLRYAQRPEVGAVGAKLLYPDGLIQHAGVVTGVGNSWGPCLATHSHVRFPADAPGYGGAVNTVRDYAAVTAACMMVRKEVYEELGGFDAENLPVAFQDVDLCLRMRERGYAVVYTPYAELVHHESASKGSWAPRNEVEYMRERWGEVLDADPYYNPHFSTGSGDYDLRGDLLRPRSLRAAETFESMPWMITREDLVRLEDARYRNIRGLQKTSLLPAREGPFDEPGSLRDAARGGDGPGPRRIGADQVIWMFGSSRTGSTWISRIMAELEDQERWHEPYVGLLFGFFLFRRVKDEKLKEGKNFIMGAPHREVWLRSIRNFVLDGAEARFPKLSRGQHLVIKEPNGSLGAPLLMDAMPESRFIFLIRDPRDVIASRMEGFREDGWSRQVRDYSTPEKLMDHTRSLADDYLTVVTKVKEAYDAHAGRKAFVRYEELRADTVGTMLEMYRTLGMEVDEERLEAAVAKHAWEAIPEEERGPGKFYRKAKPGTWDEDLTPEQVELIEEITGPLLAEFYPETFSRG